MQTIGRYTNKSSFKEKRRGLRRNQTSPEATLWYHIRAIRDWIIKQNLEDNIV